MRTSIISSLCRVILTNKPHTRCLHKSARMNWPIIPYVTEDSGMTERRSDIFSRLLNDRIVMIMEPVSDELASVVVAQLLFLQSESSSKPISMYINSPGGIVTAGMAIYDTMQYIQPPVATWCMGQACSMASLLLTAGAPGMRYSLPNARIMIHQVLGGTQGQATDIHIHAKEILRMKNVLNTLYAKHTNQPLDVIENSTERDNFMSPDQAKEFGLIDHVCEITPVLEE